MEVIVLYLLLTTFLVWSFYRCIVYQEINGIEQMSNQMSKYDEDCLIFAARYAHTRNTSAAYIVVQNIIRNWDNLSYNTKEQLKREALSDATCNKNDWRRLFELT